MYYKNIKCANCSKTILPKQTIFKAFDLNFCSHHCKYMLGDTILKHDPNFIYPREWSSYINNERSTISTLKKSHSCTVLIETSSPNKTTTHYNYNRIYHSQCNYPQNVSYRILHLITSLINIYSYSTQKIAQYIF